MPIITKLVVGTVIKFAVKKATVKAVKKTKLKVSSAVLRKAKRVLKKNADLVGEIAGQLAKLGAELAMNWGGKDYEAHAEEHRKLCAAVIEMEDCINSCGDYLETAAEEYDRAQEEAERNARKVSTAKE